MPGKTIRVGILQTTVLFAVNQYSVFLQSPQSYEVHLGVFLPYGDSLHQDEITKLLNDGFHGISQGFEGFIGFKADVYLAESLDRIPYKCLHALPREKTLIHSLYDYDIKRAKDKGFESLLMPDDQEVRKMLLEDKVRKMAGIAVALEAAKENNPIYPGILNRQGLEPFIPMAG